jgi:hypothetical protein
VELVPASSGQPAYTLTEAWQEPATELVTSIASLQNDQYRQDAAAMAHTIFTTPDLFRRLVYRNTTRDASLLEQEEAPDPAEVLQAEVLRAFAKLPAWLMPLALQRVPAGKQEVAASALADLLESGVLVMGNIRDPGQFGYQLSAIIKENGVCDTIGRYLGFHPALLRRGGMTPAELRTLASALEIEPLLYARLWTEAQMREGLSSEVRQLAPYAREVLLRQALAIVKQAQVKPVNV